MSTISLKNVKLGDSPDPSKNFVISVPAVADGTLTIKREDGTNVLSIAADGGIDLAVPQQSYTPVIRGATTVGVGTYSVQQGVYYDYGPLVFVRVRLDWSAHTGTGAMGITLPTIADTSVVTPLATYANGVNVGANNTPVGMIFSGGGSADQRIQVYGVNNVSGGTVTTANIDTTGSIAVSGWYRKA